MGVQTNFKDWRELIIVTEVTAEGRTRCSWSAPKLASSAARVGKFHLLLGQNANNIRAIAKVLPVIHCYFKHCVIACYGDAEPRWAAAKCVESNAG